MVKAGQFFTAVVHRLGEQRLLILIDGHLGRRRTRIDDQ